MSFRRFCSFCKKIVLLTQLLGSVTLAQAEERTGGGTSTSSGSLEAEAPTLHYYSIFYGPALKNGSDLQPGPNGERDLSKPLMVKNYMGLGVNLTDRLHIGGVAYWHWVPVRNHQMILKDPYLRASYDGELEWSYVKLHSDYRYHLPVSESSRRANSYGGVQAVEVLSYDDPASRWLFSLYSSARYNFYGPRGYGYDFELYFGPSLMYQLGPTVGLTLLYEMGASHIYGQSFGVLNNDGTDLEPGITWDVTPNLNINPYINLYPGNRLSFETSSIGMLLSWKLL